MRLLAINSCNYGSTGNIMLQIAETAKRRGDEVLICYPKSRSNAKKQRRGDLLIGNRLSRNVHVALAKVTGLNGCFSFFSTICFLQKVRKWKPDVIHLHNLHNCYVSLPLLFRFLKRSGIPTVWTLHDCWSMTGQCPHFTMVKCEKWKTGCHHCPQAHVYPAAFVDRTRFMWKRKRQWFRGVKNLTIVTPSQWLAGCVKESFLKDYPVKVIHNGIDLSVFRPCRSDFRERYRIPESEKIVLGVSFTWNKRKGIDVFTELAKRFAGRPYRIVLVGTDAETEKELPSGIISIRKTQNQAELAEIYSAADVFMNPTREDTLPTVNIEALACGIPVITFKTGGSPEIVDESCGCVVPCDDIDALEKEIIRVCTEEPYPANACRKRAEKFGKQDKFQEYVQLYHWLCKGAK